MHWRNRFSITIMGVCLVTAGNAGSVWAHSDPPTIIQHLDMRSSRVGWAIVDGLVARTINSGQHWTTFRSVPKTLVSEDFVSSQMAVVATQPESSSGSTDAVLWITRNGGQRWIHRTLPDSRDGVSQLQFINAHDGWASTNMEGSSFTESLVLLRTTTGGNTWHRSPASADVVQAASATRPGGAIPYDGIKNAPIFVTPAIGWISGGTSNRPVWLGTADSGNTWAPSPLPTHIAGIPITWTESPSFVTPTMGWLPVASGTHALGFLHTNNQGRSWQPASPDFNTTNTVGPAMQWSFFGSSSGWLLDHVSSQVTRLYYTADQGHRWVRLDTHQPIHTWQQIDFVSATVGFAIAQQPNGSDTLWRTENAGHSWNQIPRR
jgi:photosystem II stability/assembly factor-like uncharacterized protein